MAGNLRSQSPQAIAHAAGNAQQDCWVVSGEEGVRVFNVSPLVCLASVDESRIGSVRLAAILDRSNLIAFVGGGNRAKFASNTVMIWDDKRKECVLEVTLKGGPVLNVFMSYTRLVVVQSKRIHVFKFPSPCSLIRSEDTMTNPTGLASVSEEADGCQLLAFPSFRIGSVTLMKLHALTEKSSLAPVQIDAHKTDIAQLVLNRQGILLATGSTKGTVVRVWCTRRASLLYELRRGADPANLHCFLFSPCSEMLAVSSDKGTIHIFNVRDNDEDKRTLLKQVVALGAKERRSVAQVSVEPRVLSLAFPRRHDGVYQSIAALCADGTFHRFQFQSDGTVIREAFDYALQLGNEQNFWTQPV